MFSEAMRLNFWPLTAVCYPTEVLGKLYMPTINWFLRTGCAFSSNPTQMTRPGGADLIISIQPGYADGWVIFRLPGLNTSLPAWWCSTLAAVILVLFIIAAHPKRWLSQRKIPE
jgi:hypothetical protein